MGEEELVLLFLGQSRIELYLTRLKKKAATVDKQMELDLTDLEIAVICAYTDIYYDEVNKYLRGESFKSKHTNEQFQAFTNLLSRALSKFPTVMGRMRRDVWFSQETLNRFRAGIGKTIKFSAFTSSTKLSRKVMEGKGYNCRMDLNSLSGRDISAFSYYGREEQEVIFDVDTKFVIKSVEVDELKKTVTVILLDEIIEE
ncbi:hypothetical protein DBL02_12715 [Acinetobacter oleivorans]|uniref:ADP-ribosyltransferase domain-containing protein n=1 Tax=Acinetobacter oleivorans TaxID=1148157 RepID=UPI000D31FCDC|nr:ADP-ribosyltransferase domain-containing protein [Acinetobacter oleivorans]PTV44542.1 hypothetical protein DBL02_12715 [Acinetobacter oleivorans]